jgi:hypothetical protein
MSMVLRLLVMSSVIETSGCARSLFVVQGQIPRLRFAALGMTKRIKSAAIGMTEGEILRFRNTRYAIRRTSKPNFACKCCGQLL